MSIFRPDVYIKRAASLSAAQLAQWGTRALILDVDNTLTTHNNPLPDRDILIWLDAMKSLDMHVVILSNNSNARVRPFAEALGLEYTANAWKPLKKGFRETADRLQVTPEQMTVVGDQIFTDILGGNRFGAKTVLVQPMEPEVSWGFRLKRVLERGILRGLEPGD